MYIIMKLITWPNIGKILHSQSPHSEIQTKLSAKVNFWKIYNNSLRISIL